MSITARIDAVTQIPEAWYSTTLPAPPSIKVEVSSRCPYRCSFCALRTRQNSADSAKDMDLDLFRRVAHGAREAGVSEIGLFFLGESFSSPDLLVECCQVAKQEAGFDYVFLTTNGALAKPEIVRALMANGLDSLKFSINAGDPGQFEDIMGVSAKYMGKALDNLRDARRVRDSGNYATRIYASSIAFNDEQGERMRGLIETRVAPYVDEHYQLPLYSMSLHADRIRNDTGYSPTLGNSGRIDPTTGHANREGQMCWSAFREGHVRVDGHLSACCFGADDRFDIGDLTTQSFMDAWNSEAAQSLRQAHLNSLTQGQDALKGTACEVCVAYG